MKTALIIIWLICFFGYAMWLGSTMRRDDIYKTCTTTGELWLHGEAFFCVPVVRE